ncbi:leucine-rich repeat-containing protein kinase family protein [Pedobacter sandarakinus]|uniref:leucine-rich repeat-containing protein kinase family protein n=1 Tax=Pedobacter sandarakinus TaxID=353156 RepID=UPI002246745D|nr:leucine-rich repeat-containing protein kinase family protein [Pedobacter sandarakinus]MCX2576349.1 leucine-rich repeat-containing protein kinase family protein [Pedobacter sandarakinus]
MHTLNELEQGALKGVTYLKLSEQLTVFPRAIFELADRLEYLDLSGNKLSSLPEDFGRLKRLKIFFASDNDFEILPSVIGDCPDLSIVGFKANRIKTIEEGALGLSLRWLILTNNELSELPASIGRCSKLEKLMLAGNALTMLPEALGNCQNLTLLRVAANKLTSLPDWLLVMPKLAWLAFSGNAFNRHPGVVHKPVVSIEDYLLKDVLGEGASGTIFKATHKTTNKDVAVKVFKGNVTSDGYPHDEMNAFVGAGEHLGLVKLLEEVDLPTQGKKGLIMELIPPSYYNLGSPPSLETCTRDVFTENLSLSTGVADKIALTIASVCGHLHGKGITHGDLYAHNILIDADGNTLLSDFGAASFYHRSDGELPDRRLERLEVLAFGYLLDDLIRLTVTNVQAELLALRDRCLLADVHQRPLFSEIESDLLHFIDSPLP